MQIGADLRQRSANKLSGVEVQEQRTERRRRDRLVGALNERPLMARTPAKQSS